MYMICLLYPPIHINFACLLERLFPSFLFSSCRSAYPSPSLSLSNGRGNSNEIFDVRRILQGGVVQLRFVIVGPSGSGLILCVLEGGKAAGKRL